MEAVASHLSQLALKFHGYDKDGKPRSSKEEADGGAMARPVGVALLMAGVDRGNRPVLYHLDPSGKKIHGFEDNLQPVVPVRFSCKGSRLGDYTTLHCIHNAQMAQGGIGTVAIGNPLH